MKPHSLVFAALLLVGCGSTEPEAVSVSGNWVSVESFTGEHGVVSPLRMSVDPVTDPTQLSGSWSMGAKTGTIYEGGLAGEEVSLQMRGGAGGTTRANLAGTVVSSSSITGVLNGRLGESLSSNAYWEFQSAPVSFVRGS